MCASDIRYKPISTAFGSADTFLFYPQHMHFNMPSLKESETKRFIWEIYASVYGFSKSILIRKRLDARRTHGNYRDHDVFN